MDQFEGAAKALGGPPEPTTASSPHRGTPVLGVTAERIVRSSLDWSVGSRASTGAVLCAGAES